MEEISEALGISFRAAARAIVYPTHFLSVYDLQDPDDDGDIYERLTMNRLSGSAEETVIRMLTMECLREEFLQLSKKDQEILGRCFGVYGHPKSDLREIAVRNRMKESGVEKAKNQAIQRLRERRIYDVDVFINAVINELHHVIGFTPNIEGTGPAAAGPVVIYHLAL